jgi:hypothetical protein
MTVEITENGGATVVVNATTTETSVEVTGVIEHTIEVLDPSTGEVTVVEVGVRGASGVQGVPGPQGVPGGQGEPGETGPEGPAGIQLVHHGTDGSTARPSVPVVYWIGTATPSNAQLWDFQLQENI